MRTRESTPTGGEPESIQSQNWQNIRKLTGNQGARSSRYGVSNEPTGKPVQELRIEKPAKISRRTTPPETIKSNVAEREHLGRVLRDCREKAETLLDSTDPVDFALIGSSIQSHLQDLWNYRDMRGDDWTEILNVLQIMLTGQEFEILSREKRLAIFKILDECLLARTVSRTDVEHSLQILTDAGFDIWRGLSLPSDIPPHEKK